MNFTLSPLHYLLFPGDSSNDNSIGKDTWPLRVSQTLLFLTLVLAMLARLAFHFDNSAGVAVQGNDQPDETKMALPKASREDLRRPKVAWPTLMLLLLTDTVWVYSFVGYMLGWHNRAASIALSTAASYWTFTVLHDAVHNAVIPNSFLNTVVGYIAAFPLMGPYRLFKQIHLCHHRYAGDHHGESAKAGGNTNGISLDPDEWTGRGPELLLPFRWVSIFMYYVYFYFRTVKEVNLVELPVFLFTLVGFFTAVWTISPLDKADTIIVCHIVPALIAQAYLAYLFDYVPHRPHVVTYKEDPYRSTNATSLFGKVDWFAWNAFSMNQNMHVVHHIWPFLPWYRYNLLWQKHGDEMSVLFPLAKSLSG